MNRRALTTLGADECTPCAGFDPGQLAPGELTVLPIGGVGPKKIAFRRPRLHFSDPPWVKVPPGEEVFLTEMRGYQTGRNR